jgi:hypothetical protein
VPRSLVAQADENETLRRAASGRAAEQAMRESRSGQMPRQRPRDMRDAIPAAAVMDGRGARLEEVARRYAERPAVVLQLCRREVFGGGWHSGQRYGGYCEGAAGPSTSR